MKIYIILLILSISSGAISAESSKLYPKFSEYFKSYIEGKLESAPSGVQQISLNFLKKKMKQKWPESIELSTRSDKVNSVKEFKLELLKIHVIEEFDDFLNDNIFIYLYVTIDGTVYSKTTSIYKGLDEGDSVFFNAIDRQVYPFANNKGSTLIVDYGIVESDEEDIEELKKLTSVIVDLAYLLAAGDTSIDIRREVKAFTSFLISLDKSDKLVTDTLILNEVNPTKFPYVKKIDLKGNKNFSDWHYRLSFRFLKD